MCVRNGSGVRMLYLPVPSSPSSTRICVSLVLRSTMAVRIAARFWSMEPGDHSTSAGRQLLFEFGQELLYLLVARVFRERHAQVDLVVAPIACLEGLLALGRERTRHRTLYLDRPLVGGRALDGHFVQRVEAQHA